MVKNDGPAASETGSYSSFLKTVLERCSFFCKYFGVDKLGVKKNTGDAASPTMIYGRKAAQAIVEDLVVRATAGAEEISLANIDPIWKFRWMLAADSMKKLMAIKSACTSAATFKLRKVRALTDAKGDHAATAAAPAAATSAPAVAASTSVDEPLAKKPRLSEVDSTSLANIKSSPDAKAKSDVKKKAEPPLQAKLRFFSVPADKTSGAEPDGSEDVD